MPSASQKKFTENSKDVDRLLDIHSDLASDEPGRKWGVEVLNKSAVILVCAVWEAYVEDIVQEALDHISLNLTDPNKLPEELRRLIAKRVREDKHDLAPWGLAGAGWKSVLSSNLTLIKRQFTGTWNTPKAAPVEELFKKALGLADITSHWKRTILTPAKARLKLDEYVKLRGEIAHRSHAASSVTKGEATGFLEHIKRLVEFTEIAVNAHVLKITGKSLF